GAAVARGSSTSRGASPSTTRATSMWRTGRTTACRSSPQAASSSCRSANTGRFRYRRMPSPLPIWVRSSRTRTRRGYPKGGILNHPTDVAVDPDGDICVTDWGNHRLCIFDAEATPLTHLVGDAQVMSKWGQQSIDANPDMMKAYRRARNLEPL